MTDKLRIKIALVEKTNLINTDNDFKSILNFIIDEETKKSDNDFDDELFNECLNLILELDGVDVEEHKNEVDKISSRIINNIEKRIIDKKRKTHFKFKRPAMISVIAIIMTILSLTVAAHVSGYKNFIEMGKAIFDYAEKKWFTINNNETFIYSSEIRYYKTIEEMIEAENLDIVYPRSLPDGYIIDEISVTDMGEFKEIRLMSSLIQPKKFVFTIDINRDIKQSENLERIGNIDCYIGENNSMFYAVWSIDKNHYRLSCENKNDLISIIKNIS